MSMETIRRQIHPEVRIIDRKAGVVDYVASDESVDSYREVIRAAGWRFDLFKKNAPFVDTHDYKSIEKLVGKVIEFRVDRSKGQLINRVQWAIDVPDNQLAQLGWKMTEAGYLRAVSVGFFPVKIMSAMSAMRSEWLQQLRELGLSEDSAPDRIYLEQQQIELSSVIIGANSNALLAAHKAGAINDRDVELIQRGAGHRVSQISFTDKPSTPTSTMKATLARIAARFPDKTTSALDSLHKAQCGQSDGDLDRTLRAALRAIYSEARDAQRDAIERIVADPVRRLVLNTMARVLVKVKLNEDQERCFRALGGDTGFGATLLAEVFGGEIFNLLAISGAWRTLGARPIMSKAGKFPVITAYPAAYFQPAHGDQIDEDEVFAGTSVSADTSSITCLVGVSLQLMQDADADISALLLESFAEAFNARLDAAVFNGDGEEDAENGGTLGIFQDNTITAVNAGVGNTEFQKCDREDFLRVIEAVDAATLQRDCRWWVSSALLPALLRCKDDSGKPLLTRPPGAREFQLIDFPVTLTAAAPSLNAAAEKVIAFGHGPAYAVGLRNWFAFESSGSFKWTQLQRTFRAYGSARGKLRKKEGFAILKTAAE